MVQTRVGTFAITNGVCVRRHRTDVSLLQEELIAAVPGDAARGQCPQLLQLAVCHQVPGENTGSLHCPPFCNALLNEGRHRVVTVVLEDIDGPEA